MISDKITTFGGGSWISTSGEPTLVWSVSSIPKLGITNPSVSVAKSNHALQSVPFFMKSISATETLVCNVFVFFQGSC